MGGKALPTSKAIADRLRDPSRRVTVGALLTLTGLDSAGLYAWFIDRRGARDLSCGLGSEIAEGLIYAGQTGAGDRLATLGSRIGRNHLRGNTRGSTLRYTLAYVLREQLKLEPIGRRRIKPDGEVRLSAWMHEHLCVAVQPIKDRLAIDALESAVLAELDPPLNLRKVLSSGIRSQLSALRSEFNAAAGLEPQPQTQPAPATPSIGPTPEELAREMGLPDAKRVRSFLSREFPRPGDGLWSRWGSLSPAQVRTVRKRFGGS
jgi:hypothetical protein